MLGESLEFSCEDVETVGGERLDWRAELRRATTTTEAFSVSRAAAEERESWEYVFWRSAGKNEGQPFQR